MIRVTEAGGIGEGTWRGGDDVSCIITLRAAGLKAYAASMQI